MSKKKARRIVPASQIAVRKGVQEEQVGAVCEAFYIDRDDEANLLVTGHPLAVKNFHKDKHVSGFDLKAEVLNSLFMNEDSLKGAIGDGKVKFRLLMELPRELLREEVLIGVDNSPGDGVYYVLDANEIQGVGKRISKHINMIKINTEEGEDVG